MARINGTKKNDSLTGTDDADVILGKGGNDALFGGEGNDTIKGAGGADTLTAGLGNDLLFGGQGNDTLVFNRRGEDMFFGGSGRDTLDLSKFGNPLNIFDTNVSDRVGVELVSFDSIENIIGTRYSDVIDFRTTGREDVATSIFGGRGQDTLKGANKNDLLKGGAGNDTMEGFDGDDRLFGGAGSDTLIAGNGADKLFGGAGNDFLSGRQTLFLGSGTGDGADVLNGGKGNDVFRFVSEGSTIIGGKGADRLDFQPTENFDEIRMRDFEVDQDLINLLFIRKDAENAFTLEDILGLSTTRKGDTTISLDIGDVVLEGVKKSELTEDNFWFEFMT